MKYTERLFPDLSQSMASGRTSTEGVKKKLPFKAPSRVSGASASSKPAPSKVTKKPAPKRKSPAKASVASKSKANGFKPASKAGAVVLSSDDESDELDDSPPKTKKQPQRAVISEDEEGDDVESSEEEEQATRKPESRRKMPNEPAIPQKLLTRLLYEGFEDKNMKIGKEAMSVVGKYMETFVREALARAVYERAEAEAEIGKGTGDGFLQVEDLEKLAPQLLLDF